MKRFPRSLCSLPPEGAQASRAKYQGDPVDLMRREA